MIKFTRNEDGSYTEHGEFAAAPAAVQLQIVDPARAHDKPFGMYTLAAALNMLRDATKERKHVKYQEYRIVGVPEESGSGRAAVRRKAEETASRTGEAVEGRPERAQKEPRTPGKSTLDKGKIAELYAAGKSVGAIARELGASYMGVRLNLISQGLFKVA